MFIICKLETLLTAQNWKWVSSLSVNVKINIFETSSVTSANVNKFFCYVSRDRIKHKLVSLSRFLNSLPYFLFNIKMLKTQQEYEEVFYKNLNSQITRKAPLCTLFTSVTTSLHSNTLVSLILLLTTIYCIP